jgi:hypothetical protein
LAKTFDLGINGSQVIAFALDDMSWRFIHKRTIGEAGTAAVGILLCVIEFFG